MGAWGAAPAGSRGSAPGGVEGAEPRNGTGRGGEGEENPAPPPRVRDTTSGARGWVPRAPLGVQKDGTGRQPKMMPYALLPVRLS
ncbi:hypothetical protein GCM10010094_44420 [Streptomyces flaveus]|uniref:Uncharacterized protein n=1 Tax=Streptomyces flaveus TaxID=66370 RepID=A0A917QZZ8_9ACTN|nr:hypothetical protein GCM10010094_44420 [Streptomyces flaveus]